ncbi:UDP-N-acetylmuramoyl-tripeptide--D-alanyl-D-alanine ligase [Bartonella sp. DGB1]|uniref:UDP-N-acetylmuramoyl-tripeptide--D-alanyl-D- alanine ligase n=1 Tax=Bartonella sp. DGB1 TaxID=3239807 RepID=UPI0035244DF4
MQYLWDRNELVNILGNKIIGNLVMGVTGVSIDSRSLQKGDIFFAINGNNYDGHDFLEHAIKAGAAAIVADKKYLDKITNLIEIYSKNITVFLVDDVLLALEKLAIFARARTKAKVIAVTGSVGKTTTKELFLVALQQIGKTHVSPASFNNHWGVPLSLARLPKDYDYAIFEIGMNHKGEIDKLSKMVKPDIGVVTLIAPAHLGAFSSLHEIALAKAELFDNMNLSATIFLNKDDIFTDVLITKVPANVQIKYFGVSSEDINYKASNIVNYSDKIKFFFKDVDNNISFPVNLKLMPLHIVKNSIAVLGVVAYLKEDLSKAIKGIENFSLGAGRGLTYKINIADKGEIVIIDESYNANPVSMIETLKFFASLTNSKGKKIAILADMLELGEQTQYYHENLAEVILSLKLDKILLLGNNMKFLHDILLPYNISIHNSTIEELYENLLKNINKDDYLMLKGSNAMDLKKLLSKISEI